jgi:hypothetical protein
MLPTVWGGLLWIWLNVGVFFWTLRAFMRRILPGDWTPQREGIYLILVLLATARSFWSGQSNMLIFSLVALGFMAIADKRWWRAALMLSIPVHIKVWPVAAALLLIARWPRKLALRFGVCVLGVAAIPFLIKPFTWVCKQYAGWYALLVGPAQHRHSYHDAWTIWEQLFPPVNPHAYIALQLLTAAAVLGLCLWQAWRRQPVARLLLFMLVTWASWQMLFGPATERNTFGLIAPLTSWGLIACFEQKRWRPLMALAFAMMVGASCGAIERFAGHYIPLAPAGHPIGVLLFAAWFLWWNQTSPVPETLPAPQSVDAAMHVRVVARKHGGARSLRPAILIETIGED